MYSVLRTRILYDTPALSKVVLGSVRGGEVKEMFMNIYISIYLFIYLFILSVHVASVQWVSAWDRIVPCGNLCVY